jgi:hypothetical protein
LNLGDVQFLRYLLVGEEPSDVGVRNEQKVRRAKRTPRHLGVEVGIR